MSIVQITGRRITASLWLAKLVALCCHYAPGLGGSALPGLVALKIDPKIISKLARKNHLSSIMISGTNGKTTTSRLVGEVLKVSQIQYIQNRTGSNLLRGICSSLINQTSASGQLLAKLAVWETDEAVVLTAVKQLKPQILCLTNLFRDQLDRYGEIDSILKNWQKAIRQLPKGATLIYNADDPSLQFLAKTAPKHLETVGFGFQVKSDRSLSLAADAIFCPSCKAWLKFDRVFTSHLGHYSCSSCGFKRVKPQVTKVYKAANLPGFFNHYNLLAATAISEKLNIKPVKIKEAFRSFKPAFGRFEALKLKNKDTRILLVKNPAGFNSVLNSLKSKKWLNQKPLMLILNDRIADGTDVSWIWDVDFKLLNKRKRPIIISGLRAYDLGLRLKIAGVKESLIKIYPTLPLALKAFMTQPNKPGLILPTYTAMIELRKMLAKRNLIHPSWKD